MHFGDTGTPFDSREGRFTLGPLQCSDNIATGSSPTVYELNVEQTLALLAAEVWELYFEFRSSVCGRRMEIVALANGKAVKGGSEKLNSLRLAITADNNGRALELNGEPVTIGGGGGRLCDGRWHAVIIERSHVGISLAVDGTEVVPLLPALLPSALQLQFGGQVGFSRILFCC